MSRSVPVLLRRLATALAVVAALAFVLDGAIGGSHRALAAADSGHHHAHSHGPAGVSAHHHAHAHGHHVHVHVDHAHINGAPLDQESSAASGAEDASCCCVSCAAFLVPFLNAQAGHVVLLRTMAVTPRGPGDGIVPDGLRRPPRPLAIA